MLGIYPGFAKRKVYNPVIRAKSNIAGKMLFSFEDDTSHAAFVVFPKRGDSEDPLGIRLPKIPNPQEYDSRLGHMGGILHAFAKTS